MTPSGARRLCALAAAACLAACTAFGPRVLHERGSAFGTLVVAEEHDGTRSLRFGRSGVAQSVVRVGQPDYLHFVYARLVLAGAALAPAPRRILVVGLGAGTLPVFLHRHYPEATVDAVDIDPQVVAVAREYFGFAEDARLRAHVADGRDYLETAPPGRYDLVVLDAYGSQRVPAHLTTAEFLVAVRRALAPGGVVASNLWNRLYNGEYDAMLATYREVFAEVAVLDTRREVNHVILAAAVPRGWTRDSVAAAARRTAVERFPALDLGRLVADSWVDAAASGTTAAPLRDAAQRQRGQR